MPDGSGTTQLEDLPQDIIDNILVRLPSRDVGRCRTVSTSWRSATSTTEFMLRHHRRQSSLPVIIDDQGMPVVFGAADPSSQQLWPFLPGAEHRHKIRLRGACDGLLLVRWCWRPRFYVCNPVTRKHTLLPQPQPRQGMMGFGRDVDNNIVGFYRHRPTGEYRVLWVAKHLHERSYYNTLYVGTVGRHSPRHVRVRLPRPPSMEQTLLSLFHCSSNLPVVHGGNLHWHPYVSRHFTGVDGQITIFDAEAESFRWMRCPAQLSNIIKLFSVKGTFACSGSSHFTSPTMDIWVMQDYEAEIWAFQYRIGSTEVEASRQLHPLTSFKNEKETPFDLTLKWFNDMAMVNERELLIMYSVTPLLHCDIDGKFLGMVNILESQDRNMWLTENRLQESLIPIPYNETQEEEEEPFSTWSMSECSELLVCCAIGLGA